VLVLAPWPLRHSAEWQNSESGSVFAKLLKHILSRILVLRGKLRKLVFTKNLKKNLNSFLKNKLKKFGIHKTS
jgi:hypothetical protein